MTAPKRHWFPDWLRYGPRWGLLEKTNARATPTSVMRWAVAGAVGGALFGVYYSYRIGHWLPLLATPLLVVGGSFLGGLLEYQLDDGDDLG